MVVLQCVEMLAQSSSPDAIELCNLQSTYEMEGLLEAHDLIATGTDRVPGPTIFVPNDGAEMASNQNIANNNILNVNIPVKCRLPLPKECTRINRYMCALRFSAQIATNPA